jgi:hypothetical protein
VTAEPREVHPTAGLGEVVHQRARLGILTVLGEADGSTSPTSSSPTATWPAHRGAGLRRGVVRVTKGYEGRRPRTWVETTKLGRGALAAEMDALSQPVQRYERRHTRPAGPS